MESGKLQKNTKTGLALYLPAYTTLWFLCAALIGLVFLVNGKSFIWETDGVPQHFISFNYLCEWLRSVLVEHRFPGFFNYTLGQGMDILTTLDSYDFTDPVSILSALIFPLSRVQRYTLMIFLKLYLTGVSFLLYCSATEQKSLNAVVAGAIAYAFSGAVLFTFARHPNYANWAYYFPFLLSGVELFIRKKKRYPLVLFVFLNAVTSFYTFYMNVLLVILYVLTGSICAVCRNRDPQTLKAEGKTILQLAMLGSVGVMLAAIILLPSILAYLDNYRVGFASGYTDSLLHYEWKYYLKLPESLFAMNYEAGYYTELGLNTAMFIPLLLLFSRRGENTELKSLVFLSFLMLCIPLAGRIMNGFGYASNRWCYAVPFYVSVAYVDMFDVLRDNIHKKKKAVYLIVMAYLFFCTFTGLVHQNNHTRAIIFSALLMLVVSVFLFWLATSFFKSRRKCFNYCMTGLVLLGSLFQSYAVFLPGIGSYVHDYLERNRISSVFSDYSSSAVVGIEDAFFRVEEDEQDITNMENMDGYLGVNGTSFYWSLFPVSMFDYYKDLGLTGVSQNCRLAGLDGRSGLLELASVKYYTKPASDDGLIPYGYREIASRDETFQIYENQYALPVGYTYSSYITEDEYNSLDGIEKEQALLQAAVLETADGFVSVQKADLVRHADLLNYKLVDRKGVLLEGSDLTVSKGGSITLSVDVPEDCEIYLYSRNIKLIKLLNRSATDWNYGVGITACRRQGEWFVKKEAYLSNRNFDWPVVRDDVAFNMGYGHEGKNIIKISFSKDALLSVDEIDIIAVPMSFYLEHAKALGEYVLEPSEVGADYVAGKITVPEERILQFSIPYSVGWTAYVDGEKTDTFRSDIMYMALLVPRGEHSVELRYETPWLKTGAVISMCTLLLWIGFEVLKRHKKTEIISE